jgi:hypothetical protein
MTLCTATVPPGVKAGGVSAAFAPITPNAGPGANTLTINGLPAGTKAISVWVTEMIPGTSNGNNGSAVFMTTSVQLYNNNTQCRVLFNQNWGSALPAAAQIIWG